MVKNKNPKTFLYIIICGFCLVLTVNIFYIFVSQKTWRGLSQKDSYKKGIEYNKAIAQQKKQKDLGWKLVFNYEKKQNNKLPENKKFADKSKFISSEKSKFEPNSKVGLNPAEYLVGLELRDKKNSLIKDAKVEILFKRQLQEELDFSVNLKFTNGKYVENVDFPALGKWNAEIIIVKENEIFQDHKELFIR